MGAFVCGKCGGINRVKPEKLGDGPRCGRCHTPLDVSGAPIHVDDDALDRLVASSPVPVLVDFYADWCGPCRALAPTLDEIGRAHAGELVVAKVDTVKSGRNAGQLGVTGIPAVFLFHEGRVAERASGLRPRHYWENLIKPYLAARAA